MLTNSQRQIGCSPHRSRASWYATGKTSASSGRFRQAIRADDCFRRVLHSQQSRVVTRPFARSRHNIRPKPRRRVESIRTRNAPTVDRSPRRVGAHGRSTQVARWITRNHSYPSHDAKLVASCNGPRLHEVETGIDCDPETVAPTPTHTQSPTPNQAVPAAADRFR